MPGLVTEVTDGSFGAFIEGNEKAVVEFWDPWCSICREMAPVYEGLAGRYGGEVAFAKLNMRENREKADQYGVYVTPTFIFFVGGREVHRLGGLLEPKELEEGLREKLLGR